MKSSFLPATLTPPDSAVYTPPSSYVPARSARIVKWSLTAIVTLAAVSTVPRIEPNLAFSTGIVWSMPFILYCLVSFEINLALADRFFQEKLTLRIAIILYLVCLTVLVFTIHRSIMVMTDPRVWEIWQIPQRAIVMRVITLNLFTLVTSLCLVFFSRQEHFAKHASEMFRQSLENHYRLLEEQLSPHFLFNSLSVLQSLVASKDPRALAFSEDLSSVYRELLARRNEIVSQVQDELHFARRYLDLMQVRFEGGVRTTITVSEMARSHYIPTATLHSLLENCFKHNVASSQRPLEIYIWDDEKSGRLCVRNTRNPRHSEPRKGGGLGLENVRLRYGLLRANKALDIASSADHFTVSLELFSEVPDAYGYLDTGRRTTDGAPSGSADPRG